MSSPRTLPSLILVAWLAAAAGVRADEPPVISVEAGYASRYVSRGVERAGQSVQAGGELAGENFRGGFWTNQPFAHGSTREINLHAAYSWQPAGGLTLEAAVAHSWLRDVPGGGVDRSLETGLTATFAAVEGFTPSLAYHHDFRLRANTTQAALARSIALKKWGTFLELNFFAGVAAGHDWRPDAPGPRRQDSYGYWGGEARVPYRVGPHASVIAGLHYADAFGRSLANGPAGLAPSRNLWATLGVNLDF